MLLLKRREASEDHHVKLVAYTIILYISSLFVPFVVVASFQSLVYYSRSHWFFSTPFSAYITFMCGMLFIAVIFTVYLIFRERFEGRTFKWVIAVLLIVSIPAFVQSLTNYYYLDEDGIHYNALTSFKEKEYKWDEITKVQVVYRNHQGTTSLYQYKFEDRDGGVVTLPFNDYLSDHKWQIEGKIEENNIPVKDNFKNPIVD
ncbi:hypothetical protein [Neobacillus vireti]|uniref:Uncharacterized protein n=1 Tax=Neobacillus vireti LMG 21834 TaxID=1131730 RepID=A0AB94IMH6_9BACI|nr:hypothetical protein [Neobacillus vireti]ETI68202.1 hypothetical protein BAVI_13844 [Neobacillus vireti LMG 21834]KLT17414.1 hypothetical protein AA980_16255 [Neobacillus vireti]